MLCDSFNRLLLIAPLAASPLVSAFLRSQIVEISCRIMEISGYNMRSRVEIEISPPFEIRIVTVFFHTEEGLYILNVCVLF